MKRYIVVFLFIVVVIVIGSTPVRAAKCDLSPSAHATNDGKCEKRWMDVNVRINQIQIIGSHNSYHREIPPVVMRHFRQMDPDLAQKVDYASNLPLKVQLDLGLRHLEIDMFYDPLGGRYADPEGEHWIAEASNSNRPVAANKAMLNPGFKVLHMPDVDYRSSCLTYVACLTQIREWSLAHPKHLPIFIHGNAKGPSKHLLQMNGWTQTQALPFDKTAFQKLDEEVLSVFPRKEIIGPEDVIKNENGLKAGIGKNGWPTLGQARGKVVFVIDGGQRQARLYEQGEADMHGRIYFVDSHDPSSDDAGYTVVIDSRGEVQHIQDLVRNGFLVRTLADFLTLEPRTGDYSRSQAAFSSGAQIISTDYYRVDPKFPFPYRLTGFPGGSWVRCDPVNAPARCQSSLLDPYIYKKGSAFR